MSADEGYAPAGLATCIGESPASHGGVESSVFTQTRKSAEQVRSMPRVYGNCGGAIRFFVACSNAYPKPMSFGSVHAAPVKPIPNGAGFALNPGGNGGVGSFGTIPNGTITVG